MEFSETYSPFAVFVPSTGNAQLVIEERGDEAREVASFFARVGLPVRLAQLAIDPANRAALNTVIEATLAFPFIGNLPMPVDADLLMRGLLDADRLGTTIMKEQGDEAYRRLRC